MCSLSWCLERHQNLELICLTAACLIRLQYKQLVCALQGDPIEVAAATGLLLEQPSRNQPLALMAAKSTLGHSEPAAGIMNILQACEAFQSLTTLPILHLHSLNPHITATLDQSAVMGLTHMPRQTAPSMTSSSAEAGVAGISAFAFQGTNAHVIMQHSAAQHSTAQSAVPGTSHSKLPWKMNSHWLAPQAHLLLSRFLKLSSTTVVMQCQLQKPNLAMLLDHQVLNRALFPAAAFLELAHASATVAVSQGNSQGLVLVNATVPVALEIGSLAANDAALTVLCQVDTLTGNVSVSSQAAAGTARTHMYAGVTHLVASDRPVLRPKSESSAAGLWMEKLGLVEAKAKLQHSMGQLAASALDVSGVALDPIALDASFHLAALTNQGPLCVPASIGGYHPGGRKAPPSWTISAHHLQASCCCDHHLKLPVVAT